MKKNIIIILIVFLLTTLFSILSSAAQQDEKKHAIDLFLEKCIDENPSTHGNIACIGRAKEMWEQELKKHYELLSKKLDEHGKKALVQSQKTWLKFRGDQNILIAMVYGTKQGTMYQIFSNYAIMAMVEKRAKELIKYYRLVTNQE